MKVQRQNDLRAGFSLIEMVMVIAIIIIAAAVALPFYEGFRNNQDLKTAARNIESDIFDARQNAVAETRQYQITFNGNNYTVQQCNAPFLSICALGSYVDLQTKSPQSVRSNLNMTTNPSNLVLSFSPRGTVSVGSVTLTNSRNSTAIITTTISGRTYVEYSMQ